MFYFFSGQVIFSALNILYDYLTREPTLPAGILD